MVACYVAFLHYEHTYTMLAAFVGIDASIQFPFTVHPTEIYLRIFTSTEMYWGSAHENVAGTQMYSIKSTLTK